MATKKLDPRVVFDKIYEALDNGNYTLATEYCSRPEVASYKLAQALLGYCYASLRNIPKALEVSRQVLTHKPTEDSIVNALGCTFKLCRADKEYAECYENALAANGTEAFHVDLLYCYARMLDGKKMQQMAMKLYKMTDKPKYLFWSVTSMALQPDLPKTMLVVAEKMLTKIFYEVNKTNSPGAEELQLYLDILISQGKYSEAYTHLQTLGSRHSTVTNEQKPQLQDETHFHNNVNLVALQTLQKQFMAIDLSYQLHQWDEILSLCHEILGELPDQWNAYQWILMFHCKAMKIPFPSELNYTFEPFSDLIGMKKTQLFADSVEINKNNEEKEEMMKKLIGLFVEKQSKHARLRGPYLVELYFLTFWALTENYAEDDMILSVFTSYSWKESILEKYSHLQPVFKTLETTLSAKQCLLYLALVRYIDLFQSKHCCFMDLHPILYLIQQRSHCLHASFLSQLTVYLQTINQQLHTNIVEEINTRKQKELLDMEEDKGGVEEGDEVAEMVANITLKDTSSTSNTTSSTNKKKNKRKKNKNKAKETTQEPSSEVKQFDAKEVKALVSKDDRILLLLCSYCQLQTIETFVSTPKQTSDLRLSLYASSIDQFKNGIGGEIRILQPGDELILLNSSALRVNYLQNPRQLSSLFDWFIQTSYATLVSSYNHSFKLDLLEIYDYVGNAYSAFNLFQHVRIKYIQHDTLSYLMIPHLLLTGHWNEVLKMYKTIFHYHLTSFRESLDMMSKSLEYANYNRSLELVQFVKRNAFSLQLHTAKVEHALLTILHDKLDYSSEITSFVSELLQARVVEGGDLTSSLSFLVHTIQSSHPTLYLSSDFPFLSNLDHAILMRVESAPVMSKQFQQETVQRRETQMTQRFYLFQDLLWLFTSIVQNKYVESVVFYDRLKLLSSGLDLSVIPFSQSFGVRDEIFQRDLWSTFFALHELFYGVIASSTKDNLGSEVPSLLARPSTEALSALTTSFADSLNHLLETHFVSFVSGYCLDPNSKDFLHKLSCLQVLLLPSFAMFWQHLSASKVLSEATLSSAEEKTQSFEELFAKKPLVACVSRAIASCLTAMRQLTVKCEELQGALKAVTIDDVLVQAMGAERLKTLDNILEIAETSLQTLHEETRRSFLDSLIQCHEMLKKRITILEKL